MVVVFAGAAEPLLPPRVTLPMADPAATLVRSHYEAFGELYRAAWGDSLHFAVFHGDQERPQAVAAIEHMLADEAGMRRTHRARRRLRNGRPRDRRRDPLGRARHGHRPRPRPRRARADRAAEQGLEERTKFLAGDATDMPFPDASFDHVFAIESAYHAADKDRFYTECARVLRPGGTFVGTDWLCAENVANEGHAEVLERLREQFAIPSLIDLPTLRRHLTARGPEPDVVEDLSDLGDVRRNWEALGAGA